MIDTKELRRLAQAATPGTWKTGQYLGSLRQFVIHTDVGDKGRGSDVAFTSAAFGNDETVANARLIAAANPAAINELLDRLEAAEKERDWNAERLEEAIEELKALRAKIERMEQQEPVAVVDYKRGSCVRFVEYLGWQKIKDGAKLYALPGAQPTLRVPPDAIDAINRARETAMKHTLVARIPECGVFAEIAQDLDYVQSKLVPEDKP